MQAVSDSFYMLAVIFAILGTVFFAVTSAFACAVQKVRSCGIEVMWQLWREDFMIMVVPALSLTLICLLIGYFCGRAAKG